MKLKEIEALLGKLKGKKRKKWLEKWCSKGKEQRILAGLMAVLGCANIGVSTLYQPVVYQTVDGKNVTVDERPGKRAAAATSSEAEATQEEENGSEMSLNEMNLFYIFPDGAEDDLPRSSTGGQIFTELTEWDLDWAGAVYGYSRLTPAEMTEKMGISKACITGEYNPEDESHDAEDPSTWTIGKFRNVWFLTEDGDGNSISPYSNISQIMSLANVYSYYHDPKDTEAFLAYCKELWKASHYYTLVISDVYHCSGCVGENESDKADKTEGENKTDTTGGEETWSEEIDGTEETWSEDSGETDGTWTEETAEAGGTWTEETGETEETWAEETGEMNGTGAESGTGVDLGTDSNADPASQDTKEATDLFCPGHVDLTIVLKIAGLGEENNLFTLDASGNDESGYTQDGWQGWTEENRQAALGLAEKDWYLEYGLSTELSSPQLPVTTIDTDAYFRDLPYGLSEERKSLLRFALNSVGRVPYYWGGKAGAAGYEENHFGTTVSPDTEGRSLKGLDCSGWISWVYWSATGKRLPYQSTTGLASAGQRISREELKPGDILVRTGKDAHTVMFLGWTEDGKIRCIHETSGSVNNVTISIRDADWPYYIRLVE